MAELAYLAYLDGDNEGCREWLDEARSLNPAWVETNKVCGLLHNRLGQFDRAIPCFEQVVRERPGDYGRTISCRRLTGASEKQRKNRKNTPTYTTS